MQHREHHCAHHASPHGKKIRTLLKTDVLLPILGFFSLLWFLLRVIPKPSRAMYPCQRVAFPIASSFIVWLVGLFSSVVVFKHIKKNWLLNKKLYVTLGIVLFLVTSGVTLLNSPAGPAWADDDPFVPTDPPNTPMGVAKGIHPGRVVWAHDSNAANWNGSGRWWEDRNTNQSAITSMMSQSLRDLTGASTDAAAWDALFRYFNKTHARGDVGYTAGEKIAIKLNLNSCNDHGDNRDAIYITPQLVFALLQQLVAKAGVPAENITFYDATRLVPSTIFDRCKNVYSGVNFADWDGGQGRLKVQRAMNAPMKWSQDLTLEPEGGNPTFLPTCVAEATYLINLGQLKGHNLAGVTLNSKNLFGSIISYDINNQPNSSAPRNAGLHPYVCVHSDFHFGGHWDFEKRDMGTYTTLVDLMGHKELGGKTMLFMVDGLYSTPDQSTALKTSHKWKSFGND